MEFLIKNFIFAITTGMWLFFGLWLQKLLKDPSHQRVFNVTTAVLLVLFITPSTTDLVSEYLSL